MIICKRPVPPDNNLQKARPSGWSFARGQPCGQPHGWTDGTIKSSTRGPRGPKKTKQRKQSSYTNKRKNLYFFIAGHLYSALLLLINANKKHWNIHISQGSKLENVQLHEYIENIWKWMAVHPLLLICCGCRCCLARNFWNSCSFFSFAAVEIFHHSSGVGRLLPLRSDMEFIKYFTPVRFSKVSILPGNS